MPADWLGFVLLLAAGPREAPRNADMPLEFLEYLADLDKAPEWLRDAPEAPEFDLPPSPPANERKKEAR